MTNNNIQQSIILLLTIALLLGGCSTSRNLKVKKQYEYYANLYGVTLKGTENLRLLEVAESWLGVTYKLGGRTKNGVDCSAFIGHIYNEGFGITLPRRSADIALKVQKIKSKEVQYGDLIFFAIKNKNISHIGIYLGENKFLHASTSKGVSVAVINEKYWKKYWVSSGRVLDLIKNQSSYTPKNSTIKSIPANTKKPVEEPQHTTDKEDELQYIIPEL